MNCKALALVVAAGVLGGCGDAGSGACTSHNRVALPSGPDYKALLGRVQAREGSLQVDVMPYGYTVASPEGRVFEALGFIRFVNGKSRPAGPWKAQDTTEHASDPNFELSAEIGHQTVDALTFASTDDPSCSPADSARDATGYDAHVDRLTPLGRRLVDARALVVGYRNDVRTWDGKTHRNGVDGVYERDPGLSAPGSYEQGEPIQLRSHSNRDSKQLDG